METILTPTEVLTQLAAFIAIWALASIPAYWLHSALAQGRAAIFTVVASLRTSLARQRQALDDLTTARRQQLMEALRYLEIDKLALAAWQLEMAAPLAKLSESDAVLETARRSSATAVSDIEKAYSRASLPVEDIRQVVIDVPPEDWRKRSQGHRLGLINLIVGLALLIPIVAANAQLTGMVLRDLLPAVQPILGIPVPYAIAFVIVLMEAGIGWIHANVAHGQRDSERKITGAWLLWSAAAVGVVALEGWLYSLITPKAWFAETISQGSFGFVGGLLGLAVFGLGSLCARSIYSMVGNRTAARTVRDLGRLNSSLEKLGRTADDTRTKRNDAVNGFQQVMAYARESANLKVTTAQELVTRIEAARATPPAWAQPVERTLTLSELTERESRAYFWTVFALLALVVLSWMGWFLAVRLLPAFGVAVGLSLGFLALGLGVVTGQVQVTGRFARILTIVSVSVLVGGAAAYSGRILTGSYSARGFLLVVPTLVALTSGIQLGSSLAILAMALWRLYRELLLALLLPALAILWLVFAVVRIVEFLVGIIAWPAILLWNALKGRFGGQARAT